MILQDWYKGVQPEQEALGYYYTPLPGIFFGIVEDLVRKLAMIVYELFFAEKHFKFITTTGFKNVSIAYFQVQLAKEISVDMIPSIVNVNIEELLLLSTRYRGMRIIASFIG